MVTRTIYVPANELGRRVLEMIWEHVGCSMGTIRKVQNTLRVPITLPKRDVVLVERILKKFDLM